jgi:RHS repeat-associated protein
VHETRDDSTSGPGGSSSDSYSYDPTGNTTSRTNPNQTLTWDPEGHLASITTGGQTASYIYDANGQRLVTHNPDGSAIVYLPGQELHKTATGSLSCVRSYGIAIRSTADGLTWTAGDPHGTNQLAINATTLATTRRKQDPFGNTRGTAPPSWPDDKGFVGGTLDSSGYTHLGAREYDPITGRFISVDPLFDVSDPQSWNAYAYADNNPISLTDPHGTDPCPGGGGGCYHDGTTTNRDGVTPQQMAAGRQASRKVVLVQQAKQRYWAAMAAPGAARRDYHNYYGGTSGGVLAHVDDEGIMHLAVEVGDTGVKGGTMFNDALNYYGGAGNLNGVAGKWNTSMPSNLDAFNANLRSGMTPKRPRGRHSRDTWRGSPASPMLRL